MNFRLYGLLTYLEWRIKIFEKRMLLVLFRQDRIFDRPIDIESRIVPDDSAFVFWRIEIVALILEFGIILECHETMREPARNIEHKEIIS